MSITEEVHNIHWDDITNSKETSPTYIDGLIQGNRVSIITGRPKSGKTTLALDMAYQIATGGTFLDLKCTRAQVLYIAQDSDQDDIYEIMSTMKKDSAPDLMFHFGIVKLGNKQLDPDTNYLIDVIGHAIEKDLPDLKVVFLDLFENLREVTSRNEYSNVLIQNDILFIRALANNLNIAFILLTHDTKNSIRGYSSAVGPVKLAGTINGAYMHLIRNERNGMKDRSRILEIGGRNIKENEYSIFMNENRTFILEKEPVVELDYNIALIRNYIQRIKEPFEGTMSELCSRANLMISAVACGRLIINNIAALKNEGIIVDLPTNHHSRIYRIYTIKEE